MAKRNQGTFPVQWTPLISLLALVVVTMMALFVGASHSEPWKSVVGDLNGDGVADVEWHQTEDQCVQSIRSRRTTGICGLQCNVINDCVVRVEVDRSGLPTVDHASAAVR
jgi:hypothetical protein